MANLPKTIVIAAHLTFAIAVLYECARKTASGKFNWLRPISSFSDPKSVNHFESKLRLFVMYVSIHAFVQMLMLIWVMTERVRTGAINPLSGQENLVNRRVRIQVNTFEQSIISLLAQLALLPHLSLPQLNDVLPLMNMLFLLGRTLFSLGYPNHRSSGFVIGFLPNTAAILYSLYHSLYQFGVISFAHKSQYDRYVASTLHHLRT